MKEFNKEELKKLYVPSAGSTKGDNGKLMIIAGSILFHAASLWPLEIASKIVNKMKELVPHYITGACIIPQLSNFIEAWSFFPYCPLQYISTCCSPAGGSNVKS